MNLDETIKWLRDADLQLARRVYPDFDKKTPEEQQLLINFLREYNKPPDVRGKDKKP